MLGSGKHDDVTLIGAGVTLHACRHAADILSKEDIHARVIDCYSIKPIDTAILTAAAAASSGRIVIAEDHRAEGELGPQSRKRSSLLKRQTCPSCILPSAARQAPDRAMNSSPGPALTPTTLQAPRIRSFPALESERPDAVAQKCCTKSACAWWSYEAQSREVHHARQTAVKPEAVKIALPECFAP